MKLQKRTLPVIVVLLILSLGGLVALQYVLLTDAIRQKEETFRQNVHVAMNTVVNKLEAHEAVGKVFKMIINTSPGKLPHVNVDTVVESGGTPDSIIMVAGVKMSDVIGTDLPSSPIERMWIHNDTLRYSVEKNQHVLLQRFNWVGKPDTTYVDTQKNAGIYTIRLRAPKNINGEYFYRLVLDTTAYTMHVSNEEKNVTISGNSLFENKQQLVGRVIENLSHSEHLPIEKRVQPDLVDSLVQLSLREVGITLPYAFAITGEEKDSLKMLQPEQYANELRSSEFATQLFPNDFLLNGNQLLLYFPQQRYFILKQVGVQFALAVVFILIILLCFVYTVRTIIKQKDFAVRIVEFINTMTHEFKTPISTISVAAETIVRPDVIGQHEKVLRYGNVIRDENQRMKMQVDKILQMAVLEEGDFELKRVPLDMHELIAHAVSSIALQIEAKHGTINHELRATHPLINADPVHVANIIHNILENANKYSPEAPDIVISTMSNDTMLTVQIRDKGIGIGKEELKKVFDKYYRVPTGNRHDVKGFGLGLSYVKLMMAAHHGSATIQSEPGKGTTVILSFPI